MDIIVSSVFSCLSTKKVVGGKSSLLPVADDQCYCTVRKTGYCTHIVRDRFEIQYTIQFKIYTLTIYDKGSSTYGTVQFAIDKQNTS
jgi:hypothetical protein